MALIAREQKRDSSLQKNKKRRAQDYSTTTNGRITLVTTRDIGGEGEGIFRVYIPRSLRLKLLRTYHDCLVHPDDVNNPSTMIYEFFTWRGIRKDANRYVKRYRQSMERGSNAALVAYGDDGDDDSVDTTTAITLDVIAAEQKADLDLQDMMHRAPTVFSTATNGSIQLITARGKDKKYRIVIPKRLQPKVLRTYHDCLINPTKENNFESVLYQHFTWSGIHDDVDAYVQEGGLTEEMRDRNGSTRIKRIESSEKKENTRLPPRERLRRGSHGEEDSFVESGVEVDEDDSESSAKPIGLDEIAKEQKKDKELRQLKKEEPFVFSTVRYGNTLLTTAQNFRDNKYRIVIPRSLQGRMLLTYRECLLEPTPDRNFDTLLYNHFTWNGIHDDVDYFVKHGGRLPKREDDVSESSYLSPLKKPKKKKFDGDGGTRSSRKMNAGERRTDAEYEEWELENEAFEQKLKRIRVAFLGANRVFRSLDDAHTGLQHTTDVAHSALTVTNTYLDTQSDIQETAKQIGTYNTSQWCPTPLGAASDFAVQLRNATYEIGIELRDTALRIESEVNGIESDIEGMISTVDEIDVTLDDMKTYMNIAKVIVIFIDIIVLSLMLAVVFAWMEKQHFLPLIVRNAFIIPIFVVLLILFWIFLTLSLMGAMMGSDYCAMPDDSTVDVVMRYKDNFSSVMLVFLLYYVTVRVE
eukprot:scaffold524_cov183-Alexandrium_tamarense.AAC.22